MARRSARSSIEGADAKALIDGFDPFAGAYLSDPYPFFDRARRVAPVFHSPALDYWIVTRYWDVKEVLRNWHEYSAVNTLDTLKPLCAHARAALEEGGFRPVRALTNADPPAHTRVRRLANAAFTPRRVALMEDFIRSLAARFVEERLKAGRADLVRELAWELPARVIFKIIGVPEGDVPWVKSGTGSRILFNWGYPSDEEQTRLAGESAVFWRYAEALVAERTREPRDDFASDLIRARDGADEPLTAREITTVLFSLLTAGHETTTSLLGNSFRWLLADRPAWGALCADPSLVPNAVEEVLRIDPPVFSWRRKAIRPVYLNGVKLPEGANILAVIGSANRDPEVFKDGGRFDIRRANAREHVAFGNGCHICLGAPLARLEARVVIEELCRMLPGLRLSPGQQFRYPPNTSFRGPLSLHVEWD